MIGEFIELYRLHQRHSVPVARYKAAHYRKFTSRVLPLFARGPAELRVLDVGCGKTYPFSYMMARDGFDVTGLDTQFVSTGPLKYVMQCAQDGPRVALKSLVRDALFTGRARKVLGAETERPVRNPRLAFVRATGEAIPAPDNSFDIVFSYCAFEHIPDIERAAAECARVLKSGGIAHITYHLYTSISGSHHNRWFYPETDPPADIPPWFHLREGMERHVGGMDYGVNKRRLADYRATFSRHFDVIDEFSDRIEGQGFLTPAIRQELSAIPEEELLTAFKTVLARKR